MCNVVYFNGKFSKFSEAMTNIEDRGYQFGDGIYEVIRSYGGVPFKLREHLERLERSAEGIRMYLPWSIEGLEKICMEVLNRSKLSDADIYIQVTRGTAPRNHTYSEDIKPNLIIGAKKAKDLSEKREHGVKIILAPDVRWKKCWIKSTNLLPNIMAKQQAKEVGAFEAVQYEEDGTVTEGGSSNVFAVFNGTIVTPSLKHNILPGITRAVIIEKAAEEGINLEEGALNVEQLQEADEIFLTSTTMEVMPVVRIEEKVVGKGKPGEIARKMQEVLLK
ncbi:MAG: D-alanine aminotransferase [Clostridiales bacterium]|nr:D-alanine aminotransferase [Clostridiales bacterium]